MNKTTHKTKFKKSKILLSLLLILLTMSMGSLAMAQGYIYVHSKTLNEAGSPPITYNITGGSTVVPDFTLDDNPEQTILSDIGASENGRLWAISNTNVLYYRDVLTSNWVNTGITNAFRVDGGPGSTCFYIGTNGTVYAYSGAGAATAISGPGQFTSTSADIGSGWTSTPYVVNNGSIVYEYSGSGTTWNTYETFTGTLSGVDVNPTNGNVYVRLTNSGVRTIREITPAHAVINLGSAGNGNHRDLAVNENGELYATVYDNASEPSGWYVHKYVSGTVWNRELGSFDGSGLTGGVGNSLWLTMNSGGWGNGSGWTPASGPYPFYNIFSRGFDGTEATYIDDERVRTSAIGNSQLIPVAPGTYTITEVVPGGWDLQKILMYDPSANSSINLGTKSAIVTVEAGEVVNVVFQTGQINSFNMTTDCANAYLETFGTGAVGSYGSPVDGQTTYHYLTGNAPGEDGYYKIVNRANPDFNTWSGAAGIVDHTPSDGETGYMYAVNAGYDKGEFFRRHFTGIISGANYSFSAWIVNLTAAASVNPNVTFSIFDHNTQALLGTYSTNELTDNAIPGTWKKYGFDFVGSSSDIDLVISNNGIGGNGNDLAIDDISFSLAPPTPTIVVQSGSCTNGLGSITVTAPLSPDYEYSVDGTTWQTGTSFPNLATGSYTVYVRFANTDNCTNGVTTAIISPSICGNVFHDANGLNDTQVNGDPISIAGSDQLYVSLYNGATFVTTVAVNPDGTYSFADVTPNTTYTVVLGTDPVANATSPFSGTGNNGWEAVGEDCCDNTGGDGNTNGVVTINVGTNNAVNANFGIELQPESDDHTTTIPQPSTNDVVLLDGIGTNPPLLSGSDPEDGTYTGASGTITAPTGVIITSLPANGVLNYNGNPVTVGQTIADPSLLTIVLTGTGYTSVSFDYAYVDAAGVVDPTPATYTVNWSGSLPVTLVDFEVSKSELQVRVSWTTSSETNSSYFDIERSIDAHTWNAIGRVSAKENTDGLTQYDFIDATPAQSINYYRLKMVDQDQSFAYSKIRSISFGGVNLRMYPNPVTSELHIDNVDFNQIQKVGLYTIAGNAVYENTGVIKQIIDVSRFNSGTYVLTITLKNGEKISKTVVKN